MSQADERAVLMDRIHAGRGILLSERERLKEVAERFAQIVIFTGDEKHARKLSPTLYDEWKARERNVAEIVQLLGDITAKFEALGKAEWR